MMFENIDRVGMFPGIDGVYIVADPVMRTIYTSGVAALGLWIGMQALQAMRIANVAAGAFAFVPR